MKPCDRESTCAQAREKGMDVVVKKRELLCGGEYTHVLGSVAAYSTHSHLQPTLVSFADTINPRAGTALNSISAKLQPEMGKLRPACQHVCECV